MGMYVVQSVVHSILTLIIVEMSLRIWQVERVRDRFRYRLTVIVLPFFMYPFFQFLNPERGSFYFIEDTAIFSSMRWLKFQVYGYMPLLIVFIGVLAAISVVVIMQEIIPILRDKFAAEKGEGPAEVAEPDPELDKVVDELCAGLKIEKPSVMVIDDINPVIYTSGTKTHSIVLSRALLDEFDERQMRSALAHELAHIVRRSNVTTLLVFIVRILMFYNPVSLLEFRRLVQDDEHICDDITISLTGDPGGLASALSHFYLDVPHKDDIRIAEIKDVIEESSHNLLLHERIERLETVELPVPAGHGWFRYSLTLFTIAGVSYFVV